jgi:hypothetical protein
MMEATVQLDLFAVRSGPATVYRFPLARRADLVRLTAGELCKRAYEDGRRYWNVHAKDMRRQLKAAGLSRSEIEKEMEAYSQAVKFEVYAAFGRRASR